LRLLLLLSALIAGMTGLIAGPAAAHEPAAIAAALASGSEQARPAAEVRRPADDVAMSLAASLSPVLRDQVLAPQSHPVNERRNE
jgi:predicted methyltransferase